jgi:hypothetical protein
MPNLNPYARRGSLNFTQVYSQTGLPTMVEVSARTEPHPELALVGEKKKGKYVYYHCTDTHAREVSRTSHSFGCYPSILLLPVYFTRAFADSFPMQRLSMITIVHLVLGNRWRFMNNVGNHF